jgi:hypothetical protein
MNEFTIKRKNKYIIKKNYNNLNNINENLRTSSIHIIFLIQLSVRHPVHSNLLFGANPVLQLRLLDPES